MPERIIVCTCLSQALAPTTRRHRSRVPDARLSRTGRVSMQGMARGAGHGGRERTVPRLFKTRSSWGTRPWVLMRHPLLEPDDVRVRGGEAVRVTQSGQPPDGWDRVLAFPVWPSRPGWVWSELIPDPCPTPHLLAGHAGAH